MRKSALTFAHRLWRVATCNAVFPSPSLQKAAMNFWASFRLLDPMCLWEREKVIKNCTHVCSKLAPWRHSAWMTWLLSVMAAAHIKAVRPLQSGSSLTSGCLISVSTVSMQPAYVAWCKAVAPNRSRSDGLPPWLSKSPTWTAFLRPAAKCMDVQEFWSTAFTWHLKEDYVWARPKAEAKLPNFSKSIWEFSQVVSLSKRRLTTWFRKIRFGLTLLTQYPDIDLLILWYSFSINKIEYLLYLMITCKLVVLQSSYVTAKWRGVRPSKSCQFKVCVEWSISRFMHFLDSSISFWQKRREQHFKVFNARSRCELISASVT